MMKKTCLLLLFSILLLMPVLSSAQTVLEGDWEGFIDVAGNQLTIVTHFTDNDTAYSGTLDIPQQGAMGLALQKINVTEQDSVFFEFFAGSGFAKFKGVRKDSSIIGSFLQGGQSFPFQLKRKVNKVLPYNSEDLLIENGDITIAGTLTTPKNQSAKTCVILLSGSGAQTRDSNVLGFKVFEQLADYLTQNEIASFRFDDRGIGKSTGNLSQATLSDLASDVRAIIKRLESRKDLNNTKFVVLGHSQGGVVAARAAAENPAIDGLILMASTAVPLKEVLRFQVKQAFDETPVSKEKITAEIDLREELMLALKNKIGIDEAKENYRQYFKMIQIELGVDSLQAETIAQNQAQQLSVVFGSTLMKSLLFHNPAQDLQKVEVPTLVLFGGKDTQVTVAQNGEATQKALEKSGVAFETKIFPEANHLFQKAGTGAASEYGQLEPKFTDGFLTTIEEWIKIQNN